VELIDGYLAGTVTPEALTEASRERPEAVDTLILDTRSFLRGQENWLSDEANDEMPPPLEPDTR
jgi:hypothetical protein